MGLLKIDMYGAPKTEEFPIVSVRVDGVEVDPEDPGYSPFEVELDSKNFIFPLDFEDTKNHSIEIEYFNDDSDPKGKPFGKPGEETRNLYINGLSLNGMYIKWDEGVFINTTPWGGNDYLEDNWGEIHPSSTGDDRPRKGGVFFNGVVTFKV